MTHRFYRMDGFPVVKESLIPLIPLTKTLARLPRLLEGFVQAV